MSSLPRMRSRTRGQRGWQSGIPESEDERVAFSNSCRDTRRAEQADLDLSRYQEWQGDDYPGRFNRKNEQTICHVCVYHNRTGCSHSNK
jgi:hypothetical protein